MTRYEAITAYAVVIYHPRNRDDDCCSAVFAGNDPAVVRSAAHAWAARELPADTAFQIAVLPHDQPSTLGIDPPRLSDVNIADRRHPLFRRGFNLGYFCRIDEEKLSRTPEPKRLSTSTTPPPSPRTFGVDSGPLLAHLAPGVRAVRDVIVMTEKAITARTPCCLRQITLPIPGEDESCPAVCCRCRVSYDVEIIQEEPDGYTDDEPPYVAIFTTDHLDVAVARHRASPWEPKKRRPSNTGNRPT